LVAQLYDVISFFEIVTGTQKLNVGRSDRCAAFGIGNDVVEMEFINGTTDRALSSIPLPNLKFYAGWNDPSMLRIESNWLSQILFPFDGD